MSEKKELVGKITHYFSKIGVAIVELKEDLKVGDEISIEGKNTKFAQKVESMQVQHVNVPQAKAGESIGLKIVDRAREGDEVYRVVKP